ncbi:lamin tail domain-containing protein [Lysobacter enzymogenes]|uniref:lamin tail domain-containing protein n=1 Tax=Lysobacter enzymogenes TaxID=69 RepID=UPI001AF93EF0|nr:lamin tail domain-containing protein [Lysobacter enzymogenes]QQQ02297.1 lamin tail domain-containing protein [Lysobacter enzymogenes]
MNKSGGRLLAAALAFAAAGSAQAGVVISQVYGGGGSAGASYSHDFIELHNNGDTAVSLNGWSIQYNLAPSPAPWQRTALSGSIAPGGYYLIQQASSGVAGLPPLPAADAVGTIQMQTSGGKLVLVDHNGALSGACPSPRIDAVGISGSATCSETRPLPVVLTVTTAAARKDGGCNDTGDNAADFETATPAARNSASPARLCSGGLPQLRMQDLALDEGNAGQTLATVRVLLDRPAGPGGASFAFATRDGSARAGEDYAQTAGNASIAAGQSETTLNVPIFGDTAPEPNETFFVDVSNLAGATGADVSAQVTINNDDMAITAIEAVQGTGPVSPLNGLPVTVEGIVTARRADGFFLQSGAGSQPGPAPSAIYVAVGFEPPASAGIGNRVRVSGTVVEYAPIGQAGRGTRTQIAGSPLITLLQTDQPLPDQVRDLATVASGDLERYEGMRMVVHSLRVVAPADGILDEAQARARSRGLMYVTAAGTTPLRTPGIRYGDPFPPGGDVESGDWHYETLVLDATSTQGHKEMNLSEDTSVIDAHGVVDFVDGRYVLLLDSENTPDYGGYELADGAIALVAAAQADLTDGPGVSIATFPALRLFDATDAAGIAEPVLSVAAFERRLAKLSLAVRGYLKQPDVIGFTDVENLATLQALATRINADAVAAGQSSPQYAAHLLEGNDALGLDVGYLVKTADVLPGKPRVQVLQVAQIGKDTYWVGADGNTSRLNDRPPLVLDAVAHYADGLAFPFSAVLVSQHPADGIVANDLAGQQVRLKRQRQAEFLAGYVNQRQSAEPNTRLAVLGDFNAPEFNDGYADVLGVVAGAPSPDETTGVPGDGADLVEPNLVNLTSLIPQNLRYSSFLDGLGHKLDHILVNEAMVGATSAIEIQRARINMGKPEYLREQADSPARESLRDPSVAYLIPPPRADVAVSLSHPSYVSPNQSYVFTVTVTNRGPSRARNVGVGFAISSLSVSSRVSALDAPSGDGTPTFANAIFPVPAGWTCEDPLASGEQNTFACNAATLEVGASTVFTITGPAALVPNFINYGVTLAVSADATSIDAQQDNNSAGGTIQAVYTPGPPDPCCVVSDM